MPQRSLADKVWDRLCRMKTFRRVTAPLAPIPRPDRWIFIIGCYNSGTTLLKRILAEHEAITQLPSRGGAYAEELKRAEDCGWTRMWHQCYDELYMSPGPKAGQMARSIQRKWGLVLGSGQDNILEKSIVDAVRIPFLNVYFCPAYFVYIVRNGYAVAEGIRQKATPADWGNTQYADGYPIALCAAQWRESDRVVERDRSKVDHFLRITYEDLTEETEKTVRKITDFLNLAPLHSEKINQEWKIHGKKSKIKNMNPKRLDSLSEWEMEIINKTAKSKLYKYGYKRVN